MKSALQSAARDTDIFHSHGIWMLPNIYPARAIRGRRCPLVLSPRGMLDPWAFQHHRFRKKIMWFAGQRKTLESATCFHVTVDQEGDYVRALGCRAPIAVIPNGVDIPELEQIRYVEAPRRRLLFLARIHPKKGVDILLNAWRNVQERFPDWELQIVGPDNEGYLPKMQALAVALGVERVSFTGKILEIDKPSYYRAAHVYILPTYTENWGVSVAEALAHGLPAIVGKGAPWAGLETHQCGWWIENSIDAVTGTLEVALALSPEQLHERGARGRAWVQRDFCWNKVGQMMNQCYEWVLHGGGTRPPWIHV
jgi:glycosyltransferase involved in cell wall biosynthesis